MNSPVCQGCVPGLLLFLEGGRAQPQPLVLGPGLVVDLPHHRRERHSQPQKEPDKRADRGNLRTCQKPAMM